MAERVLHSVVVPVYDEVEGIVPFHERCSAALAGSNEPYELVYVDDGSRDGSWDVMQQIAAGDPRVRLVRLSRNFGHQVAISAGVEHAVGETVTVIDADLQDPPELIPELICRWRLGADIVYGIRANVTARPASNGPPPRPSTGSCAGSLTSTYRSMPVTSGCSVGAP